MALRSAATCQVSVVGVEQEDGVGRLAAPGNYFPLSI